MQFDNSAVHLHSSTECVSHEPEVLPVESDHDREVIIYYYYTKVLAWVVESIKQIPTLLGPASGGSSL